MVGCECMMPLYEYVKVCTRVCSCGSQSKTAGVLLHCSLPYCLERASVIGPETFLHSWLTMRFWDPPMSTPTTLGLQAHKVLPGYLHGDLNSGLYTDDRKSLTEPSLLPLVILLWWQWFLSLVMFFCVDFCGNGFFFHCLLDNLQGLLYFLYTKSYLRCILQFTVKLFWSF